MYDKFRTSTSRIFKKLKIYYKRNKDLLSVLNIILLFIVSFLLLAVVSMVNSENATLINKYEEEKLGLEKDNIVLRKENKRLQTELDSMIEVGSFEEESLRECSDEEFLEIVNDSYIGHKLQRGQIVSDLEYIGDCIYDIEARIVELIGAKESSNVSKYPNSIDYLYDDKFVINYYDGNQKLTIISLIDGSESVIFEGKYYSLYIQLLFSDSSEIMYRVAPIEGDCGGCTLEEWNAGLKKYCNENYDDFGIWYYKNIEESNTLLVKDLGSCTDYL